jgi:hypothetical protein
MASKSWSPGPPQGLTCHCTDSLRAIHRGNANQAYLTNYPTSSIHKFLLHWLCSVQCLYLLSDVINIKKIYFFSVWQNSLWHSWARQHMKIYRVIKKSLCTWWLYCNQVHRDFLITLYIGTAPYTTWFWWWDGLYLLLHSPNPVSIIKFFYLSNWMYN